MSALRITAAPAQSSHEKSSTSPMTTMKVTVISTPKSCEVTNIEKKRTELALRSGKRSACGPYFQSRSYVRAYVSMLLLMPA